MDIKPTMIFILALLSVASILIGIINDGPAELPEDINVEEATETVTMPTIKAPTPVTTPQEELQEIVVPRYAQLDISDLDIEEIARIVWLESRGEPKEGQQAVAEVILNRVINPAFPDNVHDVIHQGEDSSVPQFSTVYDMDTAQPTEAQYEAIDAAMYGPNVLPEDVVFFSVDGENDRVFKQIGNHIFCREYLWD